MKELLKFATKRPVTAFGIASGVLGISGFGLYSLRNQNIKVSSENGRITVENSPATTAKLETGNIDGKIVDVDVEGKVAHAKVGDVTGEDVNLKVKDRANRPSRGQ